VSRKRRSTGRGISAAFAIDLLAERIEKVGYADLCNKFMQYHLNIGAVCFVALRSVRTLRLSAIFRDRWRAPLLSLGRVRERANRSWKVCAMPRDLVVLKSRSVWNFAMAVLRSRERDTLKLSYGSTIGNDKFRNDLRECANAVLCV